MLTEGEPGDGSDKPSKSFQITLPGNQYRYLTHLARQRRLGCSESDIAVFLLIRELDAMFDRGYHEKKLSVD
jgi:hypothetical protein